MRIVSQSRRAVAAALSVALAACSLDVAPPDLGTPIEIKLDFCANDTPIWFVFQDANNPFEVVTPNSAGTFTFQARSRVAVAYVRQRGNDFRTDIIFTTNEALAQLANLTCLEQGGSKGVNGSVTGLTGSQIGIVSLSTSSAIVGPGQTAWTLTQLVDRPLDLIASRVDVAGTDQHASKTIIRRSQNPANASTIAALAFDTEGFAPSLTMFSLSGIGVSDQTVAQSEFVSALGTSHTLSIVDNITDGPTTIETIPANELTTTDYHKVSVTATSSNGAARVAERYFRTLANQTMTVGPPLIEPSVTVIGTTPHVRMRTQVLGQVDYSTMINQAYHQETSTQAIDISMTVTASYFSGTPNEWDLPMPNFSGLPGFDNAWGLKTGSIQWRVTGYFGRPQLFFGAPPNATDAETFSYGSRSSTVAVNSVLASRAGSEGTMRPGHFGLLVRRP